MLKRTIPAGAIAVALLTAAVGAPAQPQCLPGATESAEQRARRQAAARFVHQVNVAQARAHAETGKYVPLAEIGRLADVPVGFVPRLTVDQWSYVISLKDLFDPCGFSLFSDQSGRIYGALPLDLDP